MTCRDIQWDKFDELLEKSKHVNEDFETIEKLEAQKNELYKAYNEVKDQLTKLEDQYRGSYSNKPSKLQLDEYGILYIINKTDEYEGHILKANEDIITVEFSYHYGQYTATVDVPVKELKEDGCYKTTFDNWGPNNTIYVIDRVKDPLKLFEIIKFRLSNELNEALRDLDWGKEDIEKGNKRVKEAKAKIKEFTHVSDSKITKAFNDIAFFATNLKIDELLKALPREICMYEGDDLDDSNK